jgi:hypothetical protein
MSKDLLDDEDEMKAEYDFKHAIRNPYARLARNGPLVRLEPDVLAVFPDSAAVNKALRMLIETAERAKELAKAS